MVEKIEKLGNNKLRLTIKISAEDYQGAVSNAYRHNIRKYEIKGYRRGLAPLSAIIAEKGWLVYFDEAINDCLQHEYAEAVAENHLRVVGKPSVDVDDKLDLAYGIYAYMTMTVEPEVRLGKYKGIAVKREIASVTDEEVEKELEKLRERNTEERETDPRPAQNGDTAVIDFKGFVDDIPFEGGESENFSLKLGSGSFIDGFEEQIVGHEPGESFDIFVTFPEGYSEELSEKEARFAITLHSLKEEIIPELDDAFAKKLDLPNVETLEDLRRYQKEVLLRSAQADIENEAINLAIKMVLDDAEVEVPEEMIRDNVEATEAQQAQQFSGMGLTLDQYLSVVGMTKEQYEENLRPQAELSARMSLVLHAIAEAEHLEADETEIAEAIRDLAKQYGTDEETLRKQLTGRESALRDEILKRKAYNLILDNLLAIE